MKFEPMNKKRSYCFVVPSFAQYFNEHKLQIYYHLQVNKAFPQALKGFDLTVAGRKSSFFFLLDESLKDTK